MLDAARRVVEVMVLWTTANESTDRESHETSSAVKIAMVKTKCRRRGSLTLVPHNLPVWVLPDERQSLVNWTWDFAVWSDQEA